MPSARRKPPGPSLISSSRPGPFRPLGWAMLAGGAVLFCLYVAQHPHFVGTQTDADMLLATSWLWDVRHHDYAWRGFQLPAVPSIFPDLLLQAAAGAVTPDDRWALFAYNVAQFAGFGAAAGWLVRLLTGASVLRSVGVSLAVIAAQVLGDASLPGTTGNTFVYFLSCIHFGPFVTSLVATALACTLLLRWSTERAVLLFVVAALSILSDRLLLVSFAVPVVAAALAVGYLDGRATMTRAGNVAAVVIAAAGVGFFADKALNKQTHIPIELGGTFPHLQQFLVGGARFIAEHSLVVAICLGLPALAFCAYPLRFGQTCRGGSAPGVAEERLGPVRRFGFDVDAATAFLWINGALAMVGVTSATALVAFVDPGSYRYLAPAFTWLLVFTAAAACRSWKATWAVGVAAAVALGFVGGELVRRGDWRPGVVPWRSAIADCLQAGRDGLGLAAGIAEYWVSRPVMVSSAWTLQVNQATPDGRPRIWGNDAFWFVTRFDDPGRSPLYNFVVMRDMDPQAIATRFGRPDRVHTCPNAVTVWKYDDAERFTAAFLAEMGGPAGPYRKVCHPVVQVLGRLSGWCRADNERPRWSRLNISRCLGDVRAENGILACTQR